jgi:hypothetical protein
MAVTQCDSCRPQLSNDVLSRNKNEGLRLDTLSLGSTRGVSTNLSPNSASTTSSKNRFEADLSPSLETYRQFLGTQLESLQSLQLSPELAPEKLEAALLNFTPSPRDRNRTHRRKTSPFSQPCDWQQHSIRKSQHDPAMAASKSPILKVRSNKSHTVKKQPQHRCPGEKSQSPRHVESPPLSIENLIHPTSQL